MATQHHSAGSGGWIDLPDIRRVPSPNVNARPPETIVDLLVIHNISLPPGQFGTGDVARLFSNTLDFDAHPWFDQIRDLKVSAHFLIERDGQITQFASCHDRAWHAGQSTFNDRSACNDFSIGIELEGTDDLPYTDAQYQQLGQLTHAIQAICPLNHVRGHCHIAPTRKTDPGRAFDWPRYARLGNWQLHQLPESDA